MTFSSWKMSANW